TYRQGQTVNITLRKINISATPRNLFYTTAQRFEFEAVRANGTVVWRWSEGRVFAQQTTTITLRPGQSQVFRATWDQRNSQGSQVVPQNITIRGFNWAQNLRSRFIPITISIVRPGPTPLPTPTPTISPTTPPAGCQPGVNLLTNAGFEDWPNPGSPPPGWQGENVSRLEFIRHMGRYAARLGAVPGRRATLSQTVPGVGGRIYRLAYWIREVPQVPNVSDFRVNVRVFFYNAAGQLISTADPEYNENAIPESFIQYNFTTGMTPSQTRSLEVRFIFTPESGNTNSVALDDIFFECIR
ncbi:MAG: BsuPI-related putative proteinase inhibitor, partial [Desulfocucumaceae bacterium]